MESSNFINKKIVEIGGRKFTISCIPAIKAQSEIYPVIAKFIKDYGILGLTMLPMQTVRDILAFTAYDNGSAGWDEIDTDKTIETVFQNKHDDMLELIIHMVKENFGFLTDGSRLEKLLGAAAATGSEA